MELIRIEYGKTETLGVILKGGKILCYTLELPWKDNQNDISCIPTGIYECKRFRNEKFPNTFEITNVPNRTGILFHSGVTHKDILGCIITGRDVGWYNGDRAIFSSKDSHKILMTAYKDVDTFLLRISNVREVEDV